MSRRVGITPGEVAPRDGWTRSGLRPGDEPSSASPPEPDQSASPFRLVAETAPVGIVEVDADGAHTYVNDRWRLITGVTHPVPIPFRTVVDTIHTDDRRRVTADVVAPSQRGEEWTTEARMVRPDGSLRHVRLQGVPLLDDHQVVSGYVGTVMDITDLVEANEGRRRSERRYRDLIAHAPVGQAVYLMNGRLVEVNRAWADLLGYTAAEVVGHRARDYVHPDDRGDLQGLVDQLVSGRIDSFHAERRLLHRDGHSIWVSSNIALERDADGKPLHFHSLITDITERKAAEEALRADEQRYRDVVESLHDGVLVHDRERLLSANAAAEQQLGATFAELSDPLAFERLDPIAPDGRPLPFEERPPIVAMRTRQPVSDVLVGVLVPGRGRRWLLTNARPRIQDGHVVGAVVSFSDVTDRKAAEDALRASEDKYRSLVANAPIGQLLVDHDGSILEANDAMAEILGIEPDQIPSLEPWRWISENEIESIADQVEDLFAGRVRAIQGDHRLVVPSGESRWVAVTITVLRDSPGAGRQFLVLVQDITERKEAEDRLRLSEERFRTLVDFLPVGVYRIDPEGNTVYVNRRWYEIAGQPPGFLPDSRRMELVHPDDRDKVQAELRASRAERRPFHCQYRVVAPDESVRWVSARSTALRDPGSNELVGYIGSIEDITPLVTAQEETARLASIVESTSDMVGIGDFATGRLTYLNRAGREMFGYTGHDLDGVAHFDLFTDDAGGPFFEEALPTLERGEVWSGELPMRAADGSVLQVWQTLSPHIAADGTIHYISAVGRDVTEERRAQARLAYQATHDSLTGLPNRALLLDHLDLALARAERDGRLAALLFLDLDRFKLVNDTLGHDAGDELLVETARRIAEVLRPVDTVARLGGDEFVVLCEDIEDEHHALAIAQRVTTSLEATPILIGGTEVRVTASVGIALSGGARSHSEGLLRDADAAMYRAKDLGRARLELFDESMRRQTTERLTRADELAEGIANGRIVTHYQPCVDLRTGRVRSVEALARWEHPRLGLLPPAEFVSLAEETGLIVGLGLQVLSSACEQGKRWHDRLGPDAPRIHVNLSAPQLTSSNLPDLVSAVLDGSGLPASLLCLEITESVLMDDAASVIDTLHTLKAIGVAIAIDDFGTGYSSLSYLRRFPVDLLKVDMSFVDGLGPDPEDSAIVAAIVNLAHTLELEAIAEGVETAEQLHQLRRLGCGGAQGFLFARPAPPTRIEPLLQHVFEL